MLFLGFYHFGPLYLASILHLRIQVWDFAQRQGVWLRRNILGAPLWIYRSAS